MVLEVLAASFEPGAECSGSPAWHISGGGVPRGQTTSGADEGEQGPTADGGRVGCAWDGWTGGGGRLLGRGRAFWVASSRSELRASGFTGLG